MSLSTLGLKIESGGVNSTTKGIEYQNKLMLLCMCNQNKANNSYIITTEVKEAEPFGDVILQFSNHQFRLIQTKHKENPEELNFESFVKSKNFLLSKYFRRFPEIKKTFSCLEEVVICTNNSLPDPAILYDQDTGSNKISFKRISGVDCAFGNLGKRYKIDETCQDTIVILQQKLKVKQNDADFREFLKKFVLMTEVSRADIDKGIEEFLKTKLNRTQVQEISSILYNWIQNWVTSLNENNFDTLDEKKFEHQLAKIYENPKIIGRTENFIQSIGLKFRNSTSIKIFLDECEKSNLREIFYVKVGLGEVKFISKMIYQEIVKNKNCDGYIFITTDVTDQSYYDKTIKAFQMENCFNWLIIVERAGKLIASKFEREIKDEMTKNKDKRVIIVTERNEADLQPKIIANKENLLIIPEINLTHLKDESLNEIKTRTVKLQNENVIYEEIIDFLDDKLLGSIKLNEILTKKEIGSSVIINEIFYDAKLYIPRSMKQRNVVDSKITSTKENLILRDKEEFFDEKCEDYPNSNIHSLKSRQEDSNLSWIRSQGTIDYLLKFVKADIGTPISFDYAKKDQKPFILVDAPGMGKTFWMNHTANELKKNHKSSFVINFNFNSFTQYFAEAKDKNEIIDQSFAHKFFQSQILKLKSNFEQQIYHAIIKKGEFFVVFDGMDEVCPNYEDLLLKLIQAVSKMKHLGFYVSTRPEMGEKLQQKLRNLLYTLDSFTKENQIEFLTKYWKNETLSKQEIEEYLKGLEKIILDAESILGIPLMLKIIAETTKVEASNIESKFSNVTDLYEKFAKKKFEIYLKEKLGLDYSRATNIAKREEKRIRRLCEKLAANIILSDHFSILYPNESETIFDEDEIEDLRKCGLIVWEDDSDPKFIHQTFAEYFAYTKLLIEFFDKKVNETMLFEIFCEESFKVIQMFFNHSTQFFESCDSNSMKIFGKILIEQKIECLDDICRNRFGNLFKFFVNCVKSVNSVDSHTFFLNVIEDYLVPYFTYIHDNLEALKIIVNYVGPKNFAKIIMDGNFKLIKTAYQNFDFLKTPGCAQTFLRPNISNVKLVLNFFMETFDATEYREFWDKFSNESNEILEDILDSKNDAEFFEIFWSIGKNKEIEIFSFESEIIFKLDDFRPENVRIFTNFLKVHKILFGHFFEFSFNSNIHEKKLSPFKIEILPNFVKDLTQKDFLEQLKRIAFHQFLYDSKPKLNSFDESFLNSIEIIPKIVEKTKENEIQFANNSQSLKILAASYFLGNLENLSLVENLNLKNLRETLILLSQFNYLSKFDEEIKTEIRKIFLQNVEYAKYIFNLKNFKDEKYEDRVKPETFCFVFHFIFDSILDGLIESAEERNKFMNWLTLKNAENKFLFNFPAYLMEYFKFLVSSAKPQTNNKNLLKIDWGISNEILKFQTDYSVNIWDSGYPEKFLDLIDWNVEQFKTDLNSLEKILLHRNSVGKTFLFGVKPEYFEKKYLKKIPNEILQKLFRAKDCKGRTFLFSRITNATILNFIENQFDSKFLLELILEVDDDGNLFLTEIHYLHFKEILNDFEDETKRRIVLHQNKRGENFLFSSYFFNFKNFLDPILEVFGPDFNLFNELFHTKIKNGKTFCYYYNKKKSKYFENEITNWFKTNLPQNFLKILIDENTSDIDSRSIKDTCTLF